MVFYDVLDEVFDSLFQTLGYTDTLIEYKERLLETYENEDKDYCKMLMKKIKARDFKIDENGQVVSC
jgi:hypothetical protein